MRTVLSVTAGFLADALDDTLVVAPRFAANGGANCRDTLAPNEVNWTCEGKDGWLYGGSAIDNDRLQREYHLVTSFSSWNQFRTTVIGRAVADAGRF